MEVCVLDDMTIFTELRQLLQPTGRRVKASSDRKRLYGKPGDMINSINEIGTVDTSVASASVAVPSPRPAHFNYLDGPKPHSSLPHFAAQYSSLDDLTT